MKYLMKSNSFAGSKRYLKLFEEIKYKPEQKKIVSQLRYKLNKFFGRNCCGVNKVRYIQNQDRYGSSEYDTYTGTTILFRVSVPSFMRIDDIANYDEKVQLFQKLVKDMGIGKAYDFSDYEYNLTEEQMKELIFKMKYIDTIEDVKKYNL